MKYILRTLWLIGYIPIFIFDSIVFLIILFIYPFILSFYFIKTGNYEDCQFNPSSLPISIDAKYRELLKYL